VALRGNDIVSVSIAEALQTRTVNPDGAIVRMARDLGIVFG